MFICDLYDNELKYVCQRFTNNDHPAFTDQEVITIYLYAMHVEQKIKIKQIHDFANGYLLSWFPRPPGYVAFTQRINRLSEAFTHLAGTLLKDNCPLECNMNTSLLDSMPIIICSGKRNGAVAREITDKGYCSTKSMYYYGLKLHALAFQRPNRLPFPESIVITPASENDLNVFKQNWNDISNRDFMAIKSTWILNFFKNSRTITTPACLPQSKALKASQRS